MSRTADSETERKRLARELGWKRFRRGAVSGNLQGQPPVYQGYAVEDVPTLEELRALAKARRSERMTRGQ